MDWTETTASQVLIQRGNALIAQGLYPEQIDALLNDIAGAGLNFQTALTPTLEALGDYNNKRAAKDYEESHYPDTFEDRGDWLEAVQGKQHDAVAVGRAMVAAGEALAG